MRKMVFYTIEGNYAFKSKIYPKTIGKVVFSCSGVG